MAGKKWGLFLGREEDVQVVIDNGLDALLSLKIETVDILY